jgi:hypothetical protein
MQPLRRLDAQATRPAILEDGRRFAAARDVECCTRILPGGIYPSLRHDLSVARPFDVIYCSSSSTPISLPVGHVHPLRGGAVSISELSRFRSGEASFKCVGSLFEKVSALRLFD